MMQLTKKRFEKIHASYTLAATDLETLKAPNTLEWQLQMIWTGIHMEYTCKQCLHLD